LYIVILYFVIAILFNH